jgi:hypothetical protein
LLATAASMLSQVVVSVEVAAFGEVPPSTPLGIVVVQVVVSDARSKLHVVSWIWVVVRGPLPDPGADTVVAMVVE